MQDERDVVAGAGADTNEVQATSHRSQPEGVYEEVCVSLYAYRYGAIQFLKLICLLRRAWA